MCVIVFGGSNGIHGYDKDDRYPWECDIYIKHLDLFIECQFYPTHGGHPYTGTDEDKLLIEHLKTWKPGHGDYRTFSVRDQARCWRQSADRTEPQHQRESAGAELLS